MSTPPQQDFGAASVVALRGRIVHRGYSDPTSGFVIFDIDVESGPSDAQRRIRVTGHTEASVGESVDLEGSWVDHPRHGRQFKAIAVVPVLPTEAAGIERYLASGAIKGIGPKLAARLVAQYGANTLSVLEQDPDRLADLHGVGAKVVEGVKAFWASSGRGAARVLAELARYGIGPGISARIHKTFGASALEVIRTDPYRLAREVRGVGFTVADSIGQRAGIPLDAPQRVEAGLLWVMDESAARGSTGMRKGDLVAKATAKLQVSLHVVERAIAQLVAAGGPLVSRLDVGRSICIYSRRLFEAEQRIAEQLRQRSADHSAADSEYTAAVAAGAAKAAGFDLAPAQHAAVLMALREGVSVLTGGPGTGKTATLRVVLEALRTAGAHVVQGAPTGKAAKRMRASTGADASTLARLTYSGAHETEGQRVIECDVLVIDEASMLDVELLDRTLRCLSPKARIVFVGDVDQLPSVQPGRVLADIIESGMVPVTRLTEVFRQAAESAIVRNAHRINAGKGIEPYKRGDNLLFVEASSSAEAAQRVEHIVAERIVTLTGIPSHQVQVLSPMRKGDAGVTSLNARLQSVLNPSPPDRMERSGRAFAIGDRVVQTTNNYAIGVMNGESGIVRKINRDDRLLFVETEDGQVAAYPFDDLDQLDLAYAMSIHKSQGSQFRAVVIPVTMEHAGLLVRSILYTGVTRASELCVLVGQRRALDLAIANVRDEPRITALLPLLEGDRRLEALLGPANASRVPTVC